MRRALLGAAVAAATGTEPPRLRQLQVGAVNERAILLAFKQSGNGAGLESWAPTGTARVGEPCGTGWNSYTYVNSVYITGVGWTQGWRGVKCGAAGGSVESMCAPQPFLVCAALPCPRVHSSVLTSCRLAADPIIF